MYSKILIYLVGESPRCQASPPSHHVPLPLSPLLELRHPAPHVFSQSHHRSHQLQLVITIAMTPPSCYFAPHRSSPLSLRPHFVGSATRASQSTIATTRHLSIFIACSSYSLSSVSPYAHTQCSCRGTSAFNAGMLRFRVGVYGLFSVQHEKSWGTMDGPLVLLLSTSHCLDRQRAATLKPRSGDFPLSCARALLDFPRLTTLASLPSCSPPPCAHPLLVIAISMTRSGASQSPSIAISLLRPHRSPIITLSRFIRSSSALQLASFRQSQSPIPIARSYLVISITPYYADTQRSCGD
ncbi:hypothetical protein OG21DRAFT_133756 [Imleria badia]|nr:hypothetical protein OG21DRAFT_133756 [Imleria badia]